MRCKQHPGDYSSSVGVCASCLRERLFTLVAAQARQAQLLVAHHHHHHHHHHQQPPPPPPPPLFPRSVSPYVARRKSQDPGSVWSHQPLFYSTPQVGPATANTTISNINGVNNKKKKRRSLLSSLFRSRSEKLDPDPPRPSWFSSMLPARRPLPPHKPYRRAAAVVDRGMSPVGGPDSDADDLDYSYSSCRRTPAVARKGGHGRNSSASGMGFCLSPLVWASPLRHLPTHHPPDTVAGEVVRPRNLSMAASFCANRSRKLADFGRLAPR